MDLTQEEVAARLQISQSNVSRLERRRDMLVSTLREVVEAFGGELHLVAEFPDGAVEISQFDEGEAA
jgi:transcriptional regulator with XRE-family HTH domain